MSTAVIASAPSWIPWLKLGVDAAAGFMGGQALAQAWDTFKKNYYNDHKTTYNNNNYDYTDIYKKYRNYLLYKMVDYGRRRYKGRSRRFRRRMYRKGRGSVLSYKYDCPINIQWKWDAPEPEPGVEPTGYWDFLYKNNEGVVTHNTTGLIQFRLLMNSKVQDLFKEYNQVRLRGLLLTWHPNLTGLNANSSMPLTAAYVEYPDKSASTATNDYYETIDKENHIIIGSALTSRYTKFYIKYTDQYNFNQGFNNAYIKINHVAANNRLPNSIFVGSLTMRFYFSFKGRNI